ncbi:ThiJ/PfpI domain-containing protein [Basidiobolus meristosporus CBS 931.73]|uniref:ThiJ/PfpI domain-containing protein n=1 Tax=Basidiobolus meristosporus CBS 931.73 TaxID=1314790 RepID=A0A1Y1YBT6_9FUNG|nr:ThiJ/PfpI domain-containing protein [Basidiobolus meristosporus CBS 931.73]|eukprot:ORX95457.1 ThiJ/PfpI domain-containing protein [Basidiobolus meristosporus CBS 931.73]
MDLNKEPLQFGAILFPQYDLLDVTGTTRMLEGFKEHFKILYLSEDGEPCISSGQTSLVCTHSWKNPPRLDILFVPGGGAGAEVVMQKQEFLDSIKKLASQAKYIVSVCTGSAILANAGLLDGKRATSNKMAFPWVVQFGPKVNWVREARWTEDGNVFTSSGVSAGMDLAIRLVQLVVGEPSVPFLLDVAEYRWNSDPSLDPFTNVIPDIDVSKVKQDGGYVSYHEYYALVKALRK